MKKQKIVLVVMLVLAVFLVSVPYGDGAAYYQGVPFNLISGSSIFYFSVSGATYAQCAHFARYIVDTATVFGKNAFIQVLSASIAGKQIGVIPQGVCITSNNDAEDIYNVVNP